MHCFWVHSVPAFACFVGGAYAVAGGIALERGGRNSISDALMAVGAGLIAGGSWVIHDQALGVFLVAAGVYKALMVLYHVKRGQLHPHIARGQEVPHDRS